MPGTGNLFAITGCMDYGIPLAGLEIWLILSWTSTFIIERKTRRKN